MNNQINIYHGLEKLKSITAIEEIHSTILTNIPISKCEIEAKGVYIFGVGKLGQRVFEFLRSINIKVHAFVDNNIDKQTSKFNELFVLPSAALDCNVIIYIASATYFNAIYKQLLASGFSKLFSHSQAGILFYKEIDFPVEMYQEKLTEDLVDNKENYLNVFKLLEDDESKRVYDSLISFRLTLNQTYIDNVFTHISKEYFDSDVIQLDDNEVYFDIGGYDGDSADNFIKSVNQKYKSVHIFEPDSELIKKAKQKLKNYSNIVYNQLGIYDKTTTLYFNLTGGLDGIVSESGSVKIETTTIDNYKKDPPTYIKFDVEGVEIEAINGATTTIKKIQPKLAIAAYHYPKHIWEIPLLVKTINPNYKIKLRHYTDSVFDSIFYFI